MTRGVADDDRDRHQIPADGRPVVTGPDDRDLERGSGGSNPTLVTRRTALQAGLISLLGGGVVSGTAAAQSDPTGSSCEWRGNVDANGYDLMGLARLEGPLTGDQFVDTLAGSGLAINDGSLEATSGGSSSEWSDGDGDGLLEPDSSYSGIDVGTVTAGSTDVTDLTIGGTVALGSVPASGTVTLSSGKATISTGVTDQAAELNVWLGIPNATSDVDVAPSLTWNNGAGEYEVVVEELDTSVGNPDVAYRVIRSA